MAKTNLRQARGASKHKKQKPWKRHLVATLIISPVLYNNE